MEAKNTYIVQNMKLFSDYSLLQEINEDPWKEYYDKSIHEATIEELFNVKKLMVIAEPGYGKTRLLKEIVLRSKSCQLNAYFVDAKKITTSKIEETLKRCEQLDAHAISEEELQKKRLFSNTEQIQLDEHTLICIDALDEVPFHLLPEVLENIELLLNEYPYIRLFLSCRTHHLKKIDYDLPRLKLQFLQLYPFTGEQIGQYLNQDISEIYRKTKVKDLLDFMAIPRYLYYFSQLLKTSSVDAISKLSRQELFENFVYRKLDKERGPNPHSETDLLKRVLEKLALIMKIYHVSEINKDDLMSFFDNMDSNFSQIIFRDDLLNKLYDKSVLKDNVSSIEFENQEFLDYLAAKEIARFQNAEQAFYDFAIEPTLGEIFIPWFYVLPFLLEIIPDMIDSLLNFVMSNNTKVIRSEYFEVLTSLEAELLNEEQKRRIFNAVFTYYTEHQKWFITVGHDIADRLARFYLPEHFTDINNSIKNTLNSSLLYVTRSNAVELMAALIRHNKVTPIQIQEWKEKLHEWLQLDPLEYRTLHSHIVSGLSSFAQEDLEWLKSLYFTFENGIQVQHDFAKACFEVAPDDPFCIDTYMSAEEYYNKNKHDKNLSSGEVYFKYIFSLKKSDAIDYALSKFLQNDEKSKQNLSLLCHEDYWENLISTFSENLFNAWNTTIAQTVFQLIIELLKQECHVAYGKEQKIFPVLITALFKEQPDQICPFINELLRLVEKNEVFSLDAARILTQHVLKNAPEHLSQEVLDQTRTFQYFEKVIFDFLEENLNPNYLSELIQSQFPDLIRKRQESISSDKDENHKNFAYLCDEWHKRIEPEPGKYMLDLFHFYLAKKMKLQECETYYLYRNQTLDIAIDLVKNYNPLRGRLESHDGRSTIWVSSNFNEALQLLSEENVSLDQTMKDNVFRYLPFVINSKYDIIFQLAQNPSSEAIQEVIDVYAGKRKDDLKYFQPNNLLQAYKTFQREEFEPILITLFEDEKLDDWQRKNIAEALPKKIMTREKALEYSKRFQKNKTIYETMLCILIREYEDQDAILLGLKRITCQSLRLLKCNESELDDFEVSHDYPYNPIIQALCHKHYVLLHDKNMLLLAAKLYSRNRKKIAHHFHKIVAMHLEFLKQDGSYSPLLEIERFIAENKARYPELHWFEFELERLKRSYLDSLGKPKNILVAVRKYNSISAKEYQPITSSAQLAELLKQILQTDIKQWVEEEGAYRSIQLLAKKEQKIDAEDFIQKSIKAQIELALLRHGIRNSDYRIVREEQLLDDKRIDFTVSYGFVGSVVIEIKLSHNHEANPTTIKGKEYRHKLNQYIKGSQSSQGIFLIFNVKKGAEAFQTQLSNLQKFYSNSNIHTIGLNCL